MSRKNRNAGQPNRQAQMGRRIRHIEQRTEHKRVEGPGSVNLVPVKTREESMLAHPAGKGLLAEAYAESVYGG